MTGFFAGALIGLFPGPIAFFLGLLLFMWLLFGALGLICRGIGWVARQMMSPAAWYLAGSVTFSSLIFGFIYWAAFEFAISSKPKGGGDIASVASVGGMFLLLAIVVLQDGVAHWRRRGSR